MTIWTPPRTWEFGELVGPAHFNEQVRDNLLHLHQRPGCMWVPVLMESDQEGDNFPTPNAATGDWAHGLRAAIPNIPTYFSFACPDGYASIRKLQLIFFPVNSHSPTIAVTSDYGNAETSELSNAHNGSISVPMPNLQANRLYAADIAAVVPALNAGDFVGIKAATSSGANGSLRYVGLYFEWNWE